MIFRQYVKMLRGSIWILAAALLVFGSLQAFSQQLTETQIRAMALDKYKTPAGENSDDGMINVQVPQSTLTFRARKNLFQTPHDTIETTFSSWAPKSFTLPSYAQNTTPYNTVDVPQVSINLIMNGMNISSRYSPGNGGFVLRPKIGFSYAQFARSGALALSSQSLTVTDHMNFYSLRGGVEFTTRNSFYRLKPLLSVALLPSWEQSATSAFSDGISKTALLYEGLIGVSLKVLANPGLGFRSLDVEAGAEHAQAFSDNSLAATAGYAGLRATL